VMVLGYAKKECLGPGWKERSSGRCYWCGKCEGIEKTVLHPFRMMCGKVERINLACRDCYLEFSGLAEAGKKGKSSKKKGRTK